MTRRSGRLAILFGAALVVAACASGGTATDSGGGGGGTTPTDAPAATDGSVATAPATEDAGGGGGGAGEFAGDICDLVTVEEMSAVLAVPVASTEQNPPFTQGSGTCIYYDAAGNLLAATGLIGGSFADAALIFSSYKSDPSAVAVPVNGGEAIWFAQNATAIVNKGGYNGSVQALQAKDGDVQAASTSLLQTMADRMP